MTRPRAAMRFAAALSLGWFAGAAPCHAQGMAGNVSGGLSLPIVAHRMRTDGRATAAEVRHALDRLRTGGISAADAAVVLDLFHSAVPARREDRTLSQLIERALDGPRDEIVRRARAAMGEADSAPARLPLEAAPDAREPVQPRAPDTLRRPMSDSARLLPAPPDERGY